MSDQPACHVVGTPTPGGILIIGDHASNRVPPGTDLGIDPALMDQHMALDIGVAEVAERMVAADPYFAALLGNVSRLVCDFNREEDAPGLVPIESDGYAIPGNRLDAAGVAQRLDRFHRPYHAAIEANLAANPPALILSLHSFTPALSSRAEPRPWHVGVLYNQDDRGARLAIPLLEAEGLNVGDQLPYSGALLNATMNRHAEVCGRLYLGVEVRQDQIGDAAGQAVWADRLMRVCRQIVSN
ncbi:N-formylglutamate amidohydrolase [Novosphingobium sp.]|uniref:N-formylglutamate amidohydrolase n=1 Tax=Novosphingobium sp. TaxID=1874826 RepID=UPI0025E04892|nr:N-formylglutamate amidohydrolase [Novosphingobium sp.]